MFKKIIFIIFLLFIISTNSYSANSIFNLNPTADYITSNIFIHPEEDNPLYTIIFNNCNIVPGYEKTMCVGLMNIFWTETIIMNGSVTVTQKKQYLPFYLDDIFISVDFLGEIKQHTGINYVEFIVGYDGIIYTNPGKIQFIKRGN